MQIGSLLILVTMFILVIIKGQNGQQFTSQMVDSISLHQQTLKAQVQKMQSEFVQTYTFQVDGFVQFIIYASQQQKFQIAAGVFWKVDNTFLPSSVRKIEYLKLLVIENNQIILIDRLFYTVTGIYFNCKKGSKYVLRFTSYGEIDKLVNMQINTISPNLVQLLTDHQTNTYRTQRMTDQLKNYFKSTQIGQIFKYQISSKINQFSNRYLTYQIIEALFIIIITITQTIFLKRLLSTCSIV